VELILLAKEVLPAPALINFFETVVKMESNPVEAFQELHSVCTGHEDLQERLLDILSAEQAMSLGRDVYNQYCQRNDLKKVFQKIKSAFANQPGTQTRILKELQTLLSKPDASLDDLRLFASKTFKSNQVLCEEFLSLLPGGPPRPDVMQAIAPEHINLEDNNQGDEPIQEYVGYEHIDLPTTEEEKLYGSEQCPCTCHPPPTDASAGAAVANPHCIHCSIKFINGKIFVKDGKVLKPVSVEYPDGTTYESRNRAVTRKTVKGKRQRLKSSNSGSQQ